jgi:hypothetical protein
MPTGEFKIHVQSDQHVDPSELPDMLTQAKSYIKTEMDGAEEIRLRQEAEYKKRAEEDKAKDTAKKKRYLENQERRRVENRQRASGGGGGGKKGR